MATGKAIARALGLEPASAPEPLTDAELGWVVEWARELEYQYGPAERARRLAAAMVAELGGAPDAAPK